MNGGGSTIFITKISPKQQNVVSLLVPVFELQFFQDFVKEENSNRFRVSSKANLSVCEFIFSDAGHFQC